MSQVRQFIAQLCYESQSFSTQIMIPLFCLVEGNEYQNSRFIKLEPVEPVHGKNPGYTIKSVQAG